MMQQAAKLGADKLLETPGSSQLLELQPTLDAHSCGFILTFAMVCLTANLLPDALLPEVGLVMRPQHSLIPSNAELVYWNCELCIPTFS